MVRLTLYENYKGLCLRGFESDVYDLELPVFMAIEKLSDYEDTGLNPDEIDGLYCMINSLADECDKLTEQVKSLKSDFEKIGIGTEIAGYRIFALSDKRCVAQRIKKLNCEDYVVWYIDSDRTGVSNGVYFSSRAGAVDCFAGVI